MDRIKPEPVDPAATEDEDADTDARAGQPQEDVEDRPSVGTTTPEDYPEDGRAKGA